MDIPPDIEAAYAIPGKVPAAITPEYLAENRDRAPIIAIIIIGVFAILLAFLRSYARISVIKEFGIDDALALLTIVRSMKIAPPWQYPDNHCSPSTSPS